MAKTADPPESNAGRAGALSDDFPKTRVLSMDGGPPGILDVRLLRHLEMASCNERTDPKGGFLARTDVFAGNSHSSFIMLYLASKVGDDHATNLQLLRDVVDLSNAASHALKVRPLGVMGFLTGWSPLDAAARLRTVLEKYLPDMTLGDLRKRNRDVVIASFDDTLKKPRIFCSISGPHQVDDDSGLKLVDVALASSAFPLLLPMHRLAGSDHDFLDGALVANNPTMCAVARAAEHINVAQEKVLHLSDALRHLKVFSLGAHECTKASFLSDALRKIFDRPDLFSPGSVSWGYAQWLLTGPLFAADMIYQGGLAEIDYQCKMLLGNSEYHRLVPPFAEFGHLMKMMTGKASLDRILTETDAEAKTLCDATSGPVADSVAWLKAHWFHESSGT